jgi:hypothetical protein
VAVTTASSCGCDTARTGGRQPGLTGRVTRPDPGNYWPDHDLDPPTDFINERNRVAVFWKL